MLNKEDNLFKLCIFVAITVFLIIAMSILLVQGYNKKEAGLEFTNINSNYFSFDGSYLNINLYFNIENTSNNIYYSNTKTIRIVIRDSKNHIFYTTNSEINIDTLQGGEKSDGYSYRISKYISNIEEMEDETFTTSIKFVEPELYSKGYALIPFIIVFGYGVIVCLVNIFKNKKEQVSNTNEEEKSNNLEENTLSINEQDKEQNVSNTNEIEKENLNKENIEQS